MDNKALIISLLMLSLFEVILYVKLGAVTSKFEAIIFAYILSVTIKMIVFLLLKKIKKARIK